VTTGTVDKPVVRCAHPARTAKRLAHLRKSVQAATGGVVHVSPTTSVWNLLAGSAVNTIGQGGTAGDADGGRGGGVSPTSIAGRSRSRSARRRRPSALPRSRSSSSRRLAYLAQPEGGRRRRRRCSRMPRATPPVDDHPSTPGRPREILAAGPSTSNALQPCRPAAVRLRP